MEGLIGGDKHTRKLAKHQILHQGNGLCPNCPWDAFWQIYDATEEYSGHLLKSLIPQIFQISFCGNSSDKICMDNKFMDILVRRIMGHENDSVVKHAVACFISSDVIPVGVSVFSILEGMERTPSVFQNKNEVIKLSHFLTKFVTKSNEINDFTKYVLEDAKPYFPITFCYLSALSELDSISSSVFLPCAKIYLDLRIGAFQTVLRPALVALLSKMLNKLSVEDAMVGLMLEIAYSLKWHSNDSHIVNQARNFVSNAIGESANPVSLDSLRGAARLLATDPTVVEEIRNALIEARDRPYLAAERKRNLVLCCWAFSAVLDVKDMQSVVDWNDPAMLGFVMELRSSINVKIDVESKLGFLMSKTSLTDEEIFEIGHIIAIGVGMKSLRCPSQEFLRALFEFTAPRVSPSFVSPSICGLVTREEIHDSFFASKWRFLSRFVEEFPLVSGEAVIDHVSASGSSGLGDLLAFVHALLVNNKISDQEEFLGNLIESTAFGLLSDKNEENIDGILKIVFFDNTKTVSQITELMSKIIKLPTPHVGRSTIASFIGMLKNIKSFPSSGLVDLLAELVTHKEPFDESSTEGFVFGSFALDNREHSFEEKFRPSSAFMRVVLLVAIRELGNQDLVKALIEIMIKKIIAYQEWIVARKAPQTPLPFTPFHQMQLRVYQALCYWAPLIDKFTFESVVEPVLFGPLLIWSNQPDARDYLESLAIYFLIRFKWPLDRLIAILNDFSLSSQAVASFVVIGGYLASHPSDVPQRQELMLALMPFLSSNIAYIRGVSQMWLHAVDAQGLLPPDWVMMQSLLRFVKSNKESVQMRGKLKPVYALWDPVGAIESGEILTESSLIRNAELVPSRVFIDAVREGVHEALQNNWFYTRDLDSVIDEAREEMISKSLQKEAQVGGKINSQKKYVPPVTDMFPAALEEELKQNRRAETELIVVTSLLEKSTNIAGLCRTAEVFGAAKLIVPSLHVLKDPQFSSMSVTAEQWIAIDEVPESRLEGFLVEQKAMGYTIVCLEQTHDSVPIQEYDFSNSKTCLVLGNEKNGVPVPLLPLMDVCVEIPQRGVIRSLNVHVSGALAMWQYNMHR